MTMVIRARYTVRTGTAASASGSVAPGTRSARTRGGQIRGYRAARSPA
ncbi:hypothetical protein HMPREF1317_1799 [Schaalia georgiae F0490]|uniref:Uncharacterized protein n=1 Tax=Schaalia georgiae F0490 TaxID=1125717 RepID=J1HKH1_9ACTO|nr:hypothetical protein HMPREF1317_1799 [Schaalia georgiae F0490]